MRHSQVAEALMRERDHLDGPVAMCELVHQTLPTNYKRVTKTELLYRAGQCDQVLERDPAATVTRRIKCTALDPPALELNGNLKVGGSG
jgi:hypothetical protein